MKSILFVVGFAMVSSLATGAGAGQRVESPHDDFLESERACWAESRHKLTPRLDRSTGLPLAGLQRFDVDERHLAAKAQPVVQWPLDDFLANRYCFNLDDCDGKAVMRLDFDVDGDGAAEVFLANPESWQKSGVTWAAYSPAADGFEFLGQVSFHARWLLGRPQEGEFVVLRPIDVNSFDLVEWRMVPRPWEVVGTTRFIQPASFAVGDVFQAEVARFNKEAKLIETRARRDGQGQLSCWLGESTQLPVVGLRRIEGKACDPPKKRPGGDPISKDFLDRIPFRDLYEPKIIVLEMDATGDGTPELFLANSERLRDMGWLVYRKTGRGFGFLGHVKFDPGSARFEPREGLLIASLSSPWTLLKYRISEAEGIREVERWNCDEDAVPCWPVRGQFSELRRLGQLGKYSAVSLTAFVAAEGRGLTWDRWFLGEEVPEFQERSSVDFSLPVVEDRSSPPASSKATAADPNESNR